MKSKVLLPAVIGFAVFSFVCETAKGDASSSGTAFNAKLIDYRLQGSNAGFTVLPDYQGEKMVVRIELTNTTAGDVIAALRLNRERLDPLFPFIPPYIGMGARKFTVKLWAGSTIGLKNLRLVFDHGGTDFQTIEVLGTLKANQWSEVSVDNPKLGSVEQPLTGVRLESNLTPGAQGEVYLADAVLTTETGTTYALLNSDMPLMLTGMRQPLAPGPARELPRRDTITLGGYDLQNPDWLADLPDMVKFMNQHFPEADFVIAPMWTPPPVVATLLPKLPRGAYYQFQKTMMDIGYLAGTGQLPTNGRGQTLSDFGTGVLGSSPLVQAALKDQIDYGASLGINNFKQVDYVWPYFGGDWGYDPTSVAVDRDDLTGEDEGLQLTPGPGGQPAGLIHFWDYFAAYHGTALRPEEIGITDWSQYDRALESTRKDPLVLRKLLGIHIALIHYEWLRQAQRFGRWAKAVGGKHDYTLNPEDPANGGDFIYLARLADAGDPYIEYFGSPGILEGNYYGGGMYVHAADLAHKRLGFISEIGEGGHSENYLAPEVGYLCAYEVAALGFRNYQSEWVESSFRAMSDPKNAYLYDRLSAWMAQAFGFREARREGVVRPDSKILNVVQRYSLYTHANGEVSFAHLLSEAHVNFKQTDLVSLSDALNQADVIFYTPQCSPAKMTDQLETWLQLGGKTLVTHSFIPRALDYGQAEPTQDTARKTTGFPDFNLLPELSGLRPGSNGRWVLPGANLLLGSPDKPLLSELSLSGGSRILYIHDELKNLSKDETNSVMDKLAELLQWPKLVVEKPEFGDHVMAELFQQDQMEVLSLWDRDCLEKRGFGGGYGSHLLPGRYTDQFDPKVRPYPYLEPTAKYGVDVPVGAEGTYRIYRFFANKEEVATVGPDQMLPLQAAGTAMEQFYFGPDTDGFRQKLAELRKHRAEVAPFLTDIPEK